MGTRRGFLASLLATAAVPGLTWADIGNPAYLAAAREVDGGLALFGLDAGGDDLFRISLPGRGHAAAVHPVAAEAVAFARRPGTFAMVVDCAAGRVAHRLEAPAGRHFYGHGTFVDAGAVLCTTENDLATGKGRIGLWARDEGYRRIGEFASGGIGPHDVLRLPGDVLAVANGGIRTHPSRGREKLNPETMRPNLAYLSRTGEVEELVELDPDMHKASIRHLAAADGQVAFAMQWQGPLPDPAPLLGLHRRGAAPVLCSARPAEQMAMEGYAGSVAIAGGLVGITSPRGGRLHLFRRDGRHLSALRRPDICGLAPAPAGLMASDGLGGVLGVREGRFQPFRTANRAWDNHLIRIAADAA